MTPKQAETFNAMREALLEITNDYMPYEALKGSAESNGLDPEVAIEYAYDNLQLIAKDAVRGVRMVAIPQLKEATLNNLKRAT